MKKTRIFATLLSLTVVASLLTGCFSVPATGTQKDVSETLQIGNELTDKQPTPTDFDYSLERYNLIRRAYWVNGQREKAAAVPCPISDVPLGYIVLFNYGTVVSRLVVDGKISSLNSYLTPDSEYYSTGTYYNKWLPDVDGSYGYNDTGIFFFTPDGRYIEWVGDYLYSDIPFEVAAPILTIQGGN